MSDAADAPGTLTAAEAGRLDKVLADLCELSRTRLKALIQEGKVTVDGRICLDPAFMVAPGASLTVELPPPVAAHPLPQDIPLDIVYEDDDLLVVNKQAGLVVHPGAGNPDGTLVNALLHHCGDTLSGVGGVLRPGIVHRLDKDTTGLIVVAKSDAAHQGLAAQLADRSLSRIYQAIVWKPLSPPLGTIDANLSRGTINRQKIAVVRQTGDHVGGRVAVTRYKVLARYGDAASLAECRLETGRTHQIRVHMAHIGHPLLGDPLYGLQPTAQRALLKRSSADADLIESILRFPRQALHAQKMSFIHPVLEEEMHFTAPTPPDLVDLIEKLSIATLG